MILLCAKIIWKWDDAPYKDIQYLLHTNPFDMGSPENFNLKEGIIATGSVQITDFYQLLKRDISVMFLS